MNNPYTHHTLAEPVFFARALLAAAYHKRGNKAASGMLAYMNACVDRRIACL